MTMRIVAFDIETVSPDPTSPWWSLEAYRCPVVSLTGTATGVTDVEQTWWPDMRTRPHMRAIEALPADAILVGWNLVFDFSVVIAYEGTPVRDALLRLGQQGRLLDLMYLAKRIDQMHALRTRHGGYGLAAWLDRYKIAHDTKHGMTYEIRIGDRPQALAEYHARDLTATWELAHAMIADASEADLRGALMESSIDPVWADSYVRGIPVDVDQLEVITERTFSEVQEAFESVKELWPGVTPAALRSGVQLRNKLFEHSGLEPVRMTFGGQAGVDGKSLAILGQSSELARRIAAYKKVHTRMERFLVKTHAALVYCGTGCVHPQPRPASTYTGRATYATTVKTKRANARGALVASQEVTAPPIQQIERSDDIRSLFAPDPGWLWAEFDFAGQEMRLLADRSGDVNMIDAFNNGADLHSMTGARLFGQEYDAFVTRVHSGDKDAKAQRMAGKVTNLAAQYRIGHRTFAFNAAAVHGLHLSDYEARSYLTAYKRQWPGVPMYWDRAIRDARRRGYAETIGGRRLRLDFPLDPKMAYADEQSAINFPIQGSGADLKVVAMRTVVPFVLDGRARMLLELHDAVHLSVKDERTAYEILEKLNAIDWERELSWTPAVPILVDGKLGTSWGKLKEIHYD